MSRNTVFLRIRGHIADIEGLVSAIELPARVVRRGSLNQIGETQTTDVVLYQLATWRGNRLEDQDVAEKEQLLPVAATLLRLAPVLTRLDQSSCIAELYVSSIREEEQGGIEFPVELIAAAAACRLRLGLSILVELDDAGAGSS